MANIYRCDFLRNELEINDDVAFVFSGSKELAYGHVTGFTPKSIRIKLDKSRNPHLENFGKNIYVRKYTQVVKL